MALFFLVQSYQHLSTSLLSILPEGETKQIIQHFEKQERSKVLFVAVKGSDHEALVRLQKLEKKLTANKAIRQQTFSKEIDLYHYQEQNTLLLYPLERKRVEALEVHTQLNLLYQKMIHAFTPQPIDTIDPFSLLKKPSFSALNVKQGHLLLKDYGYLTMFELRSQSLEEHRQLYQKIHSILDKEEELKFFSPLFYFVENSSAIRSDVNSIVYLAGTILLLLYFFILKDVPLLLNTVTTLGSSALFASTLLGFIYSEISVFVFVFGISISTIAIDYMFHHYLHGYYAQKRPFNTKVFGGFLTTSLAFFILSFSSFILIKQITLFALFSLSFSYVIFSFLYPKIGFKPYLIAYSFSFDGFKWLTTSSVILFSLVIFMLSFFWLRFDFDLRHLDYDNQKLKQQEQFFKQRLTTTQQEPFVIRAKTLETLLNRANQLKASFPPLALSLPISSLVSQKKYTQQTRALKALEPLRKALKKEAKALNFKEHYFDKAYVITKKYKALTQKEIEALGIDIFKIGDSYLTYGSVDKTFYSSLLKYDFVQTLSLKEQFEMMMYHSITQLIFLGLLSLFTIFVLLYWFTKKNFWFATTFLLFPTSLILFYGYFVAFNILHLFMLFILLSIAIDYGIYLSEENSALTQRAIFYSLVSTFAGFGVLIFSSISALFSLGMVATIGIIAIAFLLIFLRSSTHES